jgi:uncharacterized protein (TIRG00374 family)
MSRKWFIYLVLGVIVAIVAYRAYGWNFDWPLFLSTLRNIRWGWLGISVVVTVFTFLLRAIRWQLFLSPVKHVGLESMFTTTVMGFSAIFLLGRAGELVRPLWLARREKISVSASFATIIVERFFDFTMVVGVFACALLYVKVSPDSAPSLAAMKHGAWLIVGGSVAALLFLFVLRSNVQLVLRFVPFPKLASMLENFGQGLAFIDSGRSFVLVLLHSIALWIAIAVQAWLTMRGMNLDIPLAAASLIMVGAAIGSVVQIPGIGGGFQLAFAFCMTKFFHFPPETAVSAALIAYLTNNLPTVAVTIPCMLKQGLSFKEIRNTIRNPQSETI